MKQSSQQTYQFQGSYWRHRPVHPHPPRKCHPENQVQMESKSKNLRNTTKYPHSSISNLIFWKRWQIPLPSKVKKGVSVTVI